MKIATLVLTVLLLSGCANVALGIVSMIAPSLADHPEPGIPHG